MYREVEALRLRNQLDPKRFYKKDEGEGKGLKGLPKYFAVRRVPSPRLLSLFSNHIELRLERFYQQQLYLGKQVVITLLVQTASGLW